ncbi:MAG: phosphoribosylformylglycinamidine synthase subunit PurQ [Acidobacteriaceae bacterium]
MKFGVLVFPGSNCDQDTYHVVSNIVGQPVTFLWHESSDLENCDAILAPGGFAYGDYLRTGAIAHFAPIMQSVKKFAASGGLVLGICNGFQILAESGLLPGALMRNAGLKYICKHVYMRVETADSPFTNQLRNREVLKIPIGHMEGNYFCDDANLQKLEREGRIAFRYSTAEGEITPEANPNGSLANIAGILNEGRNVLGMMPHPDRSSEAMLGSADGLRIFQSMVAALGIAALGVAAPAARN